MFQHGLDMLGPQGEVGWVSTLLPMLGEVRLAQADVAEARRCAEAIEWECRGDQLDSIGDRHQDRAAVLAAAGRGKDAGQALDRAIETYRRKENLASVRRASELRSMF